MSKEASKDLFAAGSAKKPSEAAYSAADIEVLEGLEPVRRRPGMYIGGTDEGAMHHLVAEVFDNAMDEAVAGFAKRIELSLAPDNWVTVRDDGRGIPVDPHPKFPKKSALEVILTTLHSGGKFSGKVYETSGGLHGVGISVVNALSEKLQVAVVRDGTLWKQEYSRGEPLTKCTNEGKTRGMRGSLVSFRPDTQIFGTSAKFRPERLFKFARSKGYLYRGVEIAWECDPSLIPEGSDVPAQATIHFPEGLQDFLRSLIGDRPLLVQAGFGGEADLPGGKGRIEWAVAWPGDEEGFTSTYCNTIPTPEGGTHEAGLRAALLKGIKAYGELVGNKRAANIQAEDVLGGAVVLLSLFYRDPQFQGQTKEKLVSSEVTRLIETVLRDRVDHWLTADPEMSNQLLSAIVERADERARRKADKDVNRKTITQKLRLPGKLADCSRGSRQGSELFIVEGDSAGGSAKQARGRDFQAVLPLRGKILNVASATIDKIRANQELTDLVTALGCGQGRHFVLDQLRYDKVIIMTDADVDGAHIASLLMTFFYLEMPDLVRKGHLYLAQPPLFRITHSQKTHYAMDEKAKDKLVAEFSKKPGKVEVGRFKGLGEMTPEQLKSTTMALSTRTLLRVLLPQDETPTRERVDQLMGRKPEFRFQFIQEQSALNRDKLKDALDV